MRSSVSLWSKGFRKPGRVHDRLGLHPNTRSRLVFGLFHGLGLATKLQDLSLSKHGLTTNIISFNVGVEIGQALALAAVLIALLWWRRHAAFVRHALAANTLLMTGGFCLMGYQIAGLVLRSR